jgi:hypothetical protein
MENTFLWFIFKIVKIYVVFEWKIRTFLKRKIHNFEFKRILFKMEKAIKIFCRNFELSKTKLSEIKYHWIIEKYFFGKWWKCSIFSAPQAKLCWFEMWEFLLKSSGALLSSLSFPTKHNRFPNGNSSSWNQNIMPFSAFPSQKPKHIKNGGKKNVKSIFLND